MMENRGKYLRIVETESRFRLIDGNLAGDLGDVLVEGAANVVVVAEDEGLLDVKPDSDDVSRIPSCEFIRLLRLQLVLEEEFLIV